MTYNIDKDSYKGIEEVAFKQTKASSKNTHSGKAPNPRRTVLDKPPAPCLRTILKEQGVDYV